MDVKQRRSRMLTHEHAKHASCVRALHGVPLNKSDLGLGDPFAAKSFRCLILTDASTETMTSSSIIQQVLSAPIDPEFSKQVREVAKGGTEVK